MTNESIRAGVLAALRQIAPEADAATLRADVPIREQVDLDSMDFLRFMMALHAAFGVDVPESAYGEVATLDGCVAYLEKHGAVIQGAPVVAAPAPR